jgi:hypothetical protein
VELRDDEYESNCWGVKVWSDGVDVYAPTVDGKVVRFGKETLVCGTREMRCVVGIDQWVLTGGDDGMLTIWEK